MMVIFIARASASGKTKLAEQLLIKLKEKMINCLCIKMDDYYKEIPDNIALAQYKQTTNFDDPACLDFSLLSEHIINLKQGSSINKPVFDFKIERRIGIELIIPPTVLLLEGTSSLSFANHFLPNLQTTYKIFIEVHQETLLKRRVERDLLERGYADEASILKKDIEYVRPTFSTLIEPTKEIADILINNNQNATTEAHPLCIWAEKIINTLNEKIHNEK